MKTLFICIGAFYLVCVGVVATTYAEDAPIFVPKWGSLGTGDGQFNSPLGVAVDAAGNVYVADFGNNRIQKGGRRS